jgi:integrase
MDSINLPHAPATSFNPAQKGNMPRIRQGRDPLFKGRDMARTRYQYGTIVVKQRKSHSAYIGRWTEDFCIAGGSVVRRKRATVLGIVGEITEKQARRKLEAILSRINDPGYLPESSITFQALAQEWQDQAFPEMKPSTVLNVTGHLTNHLLPFFGLKQVREITTRDIDTFFSKLTVGKKTKKNIFGTLKLILKQGRAWGNIKENVWGSAKRIGKSETSAEVIAFSDAEVEDILTRSFGPKRLFYWLAVEAGLRKGELCGLRVCDIDLTKKLLRVRQTIWRGQIQTPKTVNSRRDVPLPNEIVAELKSHIGARQDGFVFQTKNGTPWNGDLVLKRHLRKKLKVVKGNLHTFRHTFATRQLHAGVPIAVVSKILGHGSITTTLNIYAHVLAEHLEQFERQRARILGV